MSISNNIDGSVGGGANQLLDLLSLVSNPTLYEAKVKSLQATIAENKKYAEAVAPVSEILELREKVKEDKAAGVTALAEAKAKADGLGKSAQDNANSITAEASAKASQLVAEAQAATDDAKAVQADVRKKLADAIKAKADSDTLNDSLKLQLAALDKERTQATIVLQNAEKLKAEIIAKHQEFIKSL